MLKYSLFAVLLTFVASADVLDDVDVFIGTDGTGHAFPGAAYPFGAVQASPDTGNGDWKHCSGYRNDDRRIFRFSQNHLCGTGTLDLGDVAFLPFVGEVPATCGVWSVGFDKQSEMARPGYYGVTLESGIAVETTVSPHAAIYRLKYPGKESAKILLDLQWGIVREARRLTRVIDASVNWRSDRVVTGYVRANPRVEHEYFFAMEFSRPIRSRVALKPDDPREKGPRFALDFGTVGELDVKVALSWTGEAEALKNLAAEIPAWDFSAVRRQAETAWRQRLSRVEIPGASTEDRRLVFSSLYRLFLQPNNIADVGEKPYYTTFSLWDTFRAAHPLYTILAPETVGAFAESFIGHWRKYSCLPIWTMQGRELHCMIGCHSVPVLVDAWFKGWRGASAEEVWSAIADSLLTPHLGYNTMNEDWDEYDRLGYVPYDTTETDSASRTLEMAYDAACAARFARAAKVGAPEEIARLERRAQGWRKVFDQSVGFMRGRDSKGSWRTPFDPTDCGTWGKRDFTEANSWQYSFHVLHDTDGLAELFGGTASARAKLDALFAASSKLAADAPGDVTGLIGQYAHGNEPSHHIAWLYSLWGDPSATYRTVRRIVRQECRPTADGIAGNEDCGQMSAWNIFAVLGFYPVDPCGRGYVVGAPLLREVKLNLANGKTFVVRRTGDEAATRIVGMTLNGKPFAGPVLSHEAIIAGGELVVEMASPVARAVSPDGRNEIRLFVSPLSYEVLRDGVKVVEQSEIGLYLKGAGLEATAAPRTVTTASPRGSEPAPFYKKSILKLDRNETFADFGDWGVRLAARDDGVAYRFETSKSGEITVNAEKVDLCVPDGAARCWANRTGRVGCEETMPVSTTVGELKTIPGEFKGQKGKAMIYLPFVYEVGGKVVAVTESDVRNYPIWNLVSTERTADPVRFTSFFDLFPRRVERIEGQIDNEHDRGGRWVRVVERDDFLVKTKGTRTYPWRTFVLADRLPHLCEADIVRVLAPAADKNTDFSWVRPGKVAWDWWNCFDNADPKTAPNGGCTTKTYERFIDFAAKSGVEYVIFDEGWSEALNIWKFHPCVDVPYLIDYAKARGVGIILWMAWAQVYRHEEEVAAHFAKLGAKGFKVDFMDRGDAEVANFLEKFAVACAQHRMILDYHGSYRPVGLQRTWPNILNYESVHGLEMLKKYDGDDIALMHSDVAAFFLRLTAGPMDYTPGAMLNHAVGSGYQGSWQCPGSVGTRARQMAMMALYEAPLQMLCDSPTNYERNGECFRFMAATPVVWEATVGLAGSPDTYAMAARRAKDGTWYAAAINTAEAKSVCLDTTFLGAGSFSAEIYRDAPDSGRNGSSFVHESRNVKAGEKITFFLAPGGGFVVRFTPQKSF